MEQDKRTLVYKRTHIGDPDSAGRFRCAGCMGIVRDREYGAVIGVGGRGKKAKELGIAGKVTWVGIGPHKATDSQTGFLIVTFDLFRLYNADGEETPKNLAKRMFRARHAMNFSDAEQAEIDAILAKAKSGEKQPIGLLQLGVRKAKIRRSTH